MQYVSKVFLDFHDPTIEDVFQTQISVDGETGLLDILDTAGQVKRRFFYIKYSHSCFKLFLKLLF